VGTSSSADFKIEFYNTIKKEYDSIRKEHVKNGDVSTYNNLPYKSLYANIAYIFIMTDDELFNKINECERNGYATKSEACGMFRVKQHIMTSRITIAHNENLRIYWRQLIDDMADTYQLANPSFFNSTETNENGEIVDCGYVSAIKNYSSRGFGKKEICEMMEFNPASWNKFPVLEQAYNQGIVEFQTRKSDNIIEAVSHNFIRNNYFVEVVIPAIQMEAFEHKVELSEKEYGFDEDSKRVIKREFVKEKNVPGNKEMRELAMRLSSGKLLDQIGFSKEDSSKVSGIPMYKSKQITDKGTFKEPVEDAEYESAD